ncbi:hypothetical protein J4450_03340 [Candidatus Micrarchaeota archaeon]|nr:hypothetical protein [Candidatus Micrarchaeota archaeon]
MASVSFEEDIEKTKTYGERVKRLHILVDGKELHWWGRNDLADMQQHEEKMAQNVKRLFSGMRKLTDEERDAIAQEVIGKIKSCKV